MSLDPSALSRLRSSPGQVPGERRRWRRRALWLGLPVVLVAVWMARPRVVEVDTATAAAPDPAGRITVLNASGYVVARRIATVASKVTGRIVEVHVEEGRHVEAGEVLARLDDATARAACLTAERALESARRALAEIEVRLGEAVRTVARADDLGTRHLLAQAAVDAAHADADALRARLEAARAEVATSQAALAQRRQDLADLTVRAPFAGIAVSKDAQPGEMVSPISAGGGFTRTGIATLVDMDSRELEVDVNEAYIQRVHEGQSAEATLDAYPDLPLPAHVINIVPTADRQKATIKVRIAFDHLDPRILPDMGIKVRFFDVREPSTVVPVALIPSASLIEGATPPAVWVLEAGHLGLRTLTLAPSQGDETAVATGLKPGEVVVLRPAATLKEGLRARLKSGG